MGCTLIYSPIEIKSYKVLAEQSLYDLETRVMRMCSEGWLILGPANSYNYSGGTLGFMQTVVKLKEENPTNKNKSIKLKE